jgi:DNA-binding GntR family transcriptional regulator
MDNPKTLSETIAEQVADEIIRRQIPPGTRLDEQSLADRFGVSRSPIRDALRNLAATRLVDHVPRRGFSVAAVDSAELEALFEAAGELEALCAKLCAHRAGPVERKRIELLHQSMGKALKQEDARTFSALNEDLHRTIHAGARNRTLEEVAQGLRRRMAPFRSMIFFTADNRMHSSHTEHDTLVKAILARDAEAAGRAMHEHTTHSSMNALQRMGQDAAAPAVLTPRTRAA